MQIYWILNVPALCSGSIHRRFRYTYMLYAQVCNRCIIIVGMHAGRNIEIYMRILAWKMKLCRRYFSNEIGKKRIKFQNNSFTF